MSGGVVDGDINISGGSSEVDLGKIDGIVDGDAEITLDSWKLVQVPQICRDDHKSRLEECDMRCESCTDVCNRHTTSVRTLISV